MDLGSIVIACAIAKAGQHTMRSVSLEGTRRQHFFIDSGSFAVHQMVIFIPAWHRREPDVAHAGGPGGTIRQGHPHGDFLVPGGMTRGDRQRGDGIRVQVLRIVQACIIFCARRGNVEEFRHIPIRSQAE